MGIWVRFNGRVETIYRLRHQSLGVFHFVGHHTSVNRRIDWRRLADSFR
ncbi:hypothetical protein RE6C_03999 [Rhodopirellula europaea 6C]|uniref:Uncharacterized protein n=1 Tax=Rhodopirellula europaea 6C TaxID=1263867 RepID=M2ADT5_9BACT|nr:hypothetical protein RE6C_03999 [Rhodopirellula europaea 6C]